MNFLEENTEAPSASPNKNHTIWCEKYRPTVLNEYVGNEDFKKKIEVYIETNDIPHLLLYGKPGGGKTTAAKLIANSIKCDVMYINASDERGIDTVRDKIRGFASTIGFNKLKVVILDEADYLTPFSQAALRNLMETFSLTTRFILTCNYYERIIEPVVSRSQVFQVLPPSKRDVAVHLAKILTKENVGFDKEHIALIVNSHYPDIRAVINTAQRGCVDGKLHLSKSDVIQGDLKARVLEQMKNPSQRDAYKNIRQLLADNSVTDFVDFYTVLYENVDDFAPNQVAGVITTLADHQFMDVTVPDREINFMAAIVKILKMIKTQNV
jgi:replication factor C small subunit